MGWKASFCVFLLLSLAAVVSPSPPSLASGENVPLDTPLSPFPSLLSPNSSSLPTPASPSWWAPCAPPRSYCSAFFGVTCSPDPQPLCLPGVAASPGMGRGQLLASQGSWAPESLLLGNSAPPTPRACSLEPALPLPFCPPKPSPLLLPISRAAALGRRSQCWASDDCLTTLI